MQTITIIVGPDGRVAIPGTRAGQTVTLHIEPEGMPEQADAIRTPEEQEQLIQELLEEGRRNRAQADPEWLARDHDEWLYGPDGLPK
jgi:hypothetical protein